MPTPVDTSLAPSAWYPCYISLPWCVALIASSWAYYQRYIPICRCHHHIIHGCKHFYGTKAWVMQRWNIIDDRSRRWFDRVWHRSTDATITPAGWHHWRWLNKSLSICRKKPFYSSVTRVEAPSSALANQLGFRYSSCGEPAVKT